MTDSIIKVREHYNATGLTWVPMTVLNQSSAIWVSSTGWGYDRIVGALAIAVAQQETRRGVDAKNSTNNVRRNGPCNFGRVCIAHENRHRPN
jgi:hypothetical protein